MINNKEDLSNFFKDTQNFELNHLEFDLISNIFTIEEVKSFLGEMLSWMVENDFSQFKFFCISYWSGLDYYVNQNRILLKLKLLRRITVEYKLSEFTNIIDRFMNYIKLGCEKGRFNDPSLEKNYTGRCFSMLLILLYPISLGYYSHDYNSYIASFNQFFNLIIILEDILPIIDYESITMNLDRFYNENEKEYNVEFVRMEGNAVMSNIENLKIINNHLQFIPSWIKEKASYPYSDSILEKLEKFSNMKFEFNLNKNRILQDKGFEKEWFSKHILQFYDKDAYEYYIIGLKNEYETKYKKHLPKKEQKKLKFQSIYKNGVSFAKKGDYKSALKFYNKALKIFPDSTKVKNLKIVAIQMLQAREHFTINKNTRR